MEPEVVKIERRGRKRKRKDVQSASVETNSKKKAVETRAMVLVGRYVKKEFEGSGVFLGKIVSYDTGLYRVDYEDGDCEDLESGEVKVLLIANDDIDDELSERKKVLDEYVLKKYAKDEAVQLPDVASKVEIVASKVEIASSGSGPIGNAVELADMVESSSHEVVFDVSGAQDEVDGESSSDLSDFERSGDLIEVEYPSVPPPPSLPPSSGNIGVSEENVSYLLSVYSFLRSFSVCLFLSPFGLDEFVGALNSSVPNTLLDAIHVALMRALKSHIEVLSSEGSDLASKCLRSMDWSLLDSLTWPVLIVQYLTTMRYAEGQEWKEFYVDVLGRDYCTLSAGRKLIILQLLCDDALDSPELRAEVDMREESEVGSDPEGVRIFTGESMPGKVNLRRSITSCKDQEAVNNIPESHMPTLSSTNSLGLKAIGSSTGSGAVVDEDGNGDECRLCGMDGTLLCCDGCPSAYHSRCIGVSKMFIPQGAWYCPECTINKTGPNVSRLTCLRGAEVFGTDPYEQVFLGTCDHLLVMKASGNAIPCFRYYTRNDIQKVLYALTCSSEYRTVYYCICKGILQHWEFPEDIVSLTESNELDKMLPNKSEVGEYSAPRTLLAKEGSNAPEVTDPGNVLSGLNKIKSENIVAACPEDNCIEPDEMKDFHKLDQQMVKHGSHDIKHANQPSSGRGYASSADSCLYMGSSFKPQAYLNLYIQGDFAASAAASLAILSSEENQVSQLQNSSSHRKIMSANYSLQIKAFSLAAKRFYWPNYEKKLVEVPRERCGWCLSCKASISSKRGCLLNASASNATKGAAKILTSLGPSQCVEGSLASIATYIMFMEESLCGLTVGPFLNPTYRKDWHKQVEQAGTLSAIKAYLLEFERSIRSIAFSSDWAKLVDDMGLENPLNQSATSVVGSTQKRGPGRRRGRKPSAAPPEVTDADVKDVSTGFAWWRGGMLCKHVFQKGILPQSLIKNAARQGGSGKIDGVHYVEGVEVPKRSRQFLWRAAVETSKTASQLALQVRHLDVHVRWTDLVRPEQPIQDGKGPEAETSAFRNASIVDKKVVENKISYAVAFENQKHLPSRVLKNILEVEDGRDGKQKYWFVETNVPLYLIKDYEKKVEKLILPSADKHVSTLSDFERKQSKASGKNIFSFLSHKRDNMGKCLCTSCQLDISFRYAARCSACEGYCHEQCTVSSSIHMNEQVELLITCKQCHQEKATTARTENASDSPTSPLPLEKQESQHKSTAIKGGKQNGYKSPLESLNQSVVKKLTIIPPKAPKGGVSAAKNGKRNGYKRPFDSVDRSSEKKLATKESNKKRSKLSLGLIWKKKNPEDTGFEFRLKNLLLKDNPNKHLAPVCHLCLKAYNPDLMYICCEVCNKWYHADAVELKESKILDLVGFKCCRCRRIRSPLCPYMDPDTKKKLEAKKPQLRTQTQTNLGADSNSETNDEQVNGLSLFDPANTPASVNVQEDDPLLLPLPIVDQVNNDNTEFDIESGPDPDPVSGPGPQKLPVRRHMKSDKETDNSLANNLVLETPIAETSTPVVEWNDSINGFEDNMMFDYDTLNLEDMEFEPQTYFSFKELLASDEGVPPDAVHTNLDNSGALTEDYNGGEYQMGISYDEQEPMFSVDPGVDIMTCNICSQTDPCPNLYCQICGLWIHNYCSPWDEESSSESGWKCGNCREWR